ncbi:POK10 protein, partial [Regulus satrapa]|nr:POK10 protein [Regulus satrapa]
MGTLQPGLPNPAMLPEGWHLLIIDLKDCFSTIQLHPDDTQQFTFTVLDAHSTFHKNAQGLRRQFNITMEEAKGIVRSCPACGHHSPGLG